MSAADAEGLQPVRGPHVDGQKPLHSTGAVGGQGSPRPRADVRLSGAPGGLLSLLAAGDGAALAAAAVAV